MPKILPKPPIATPEQLAGISTSMLLLRAIEHHQSSHPGGRCAYCRAWWDEIDRRIPARR